MSPKQLFIILSLIFLSSCAGNTIFDTYQEVPNHSMSTDSTYRFEFEITDTTHYYDLNYKVRIDDSYRYSNMYILYKMTGPSGRSKTVRQDFTLADKSGKWLGKGYSNIFSYNYPLMKEINFTKNGTYSIEINQFMRVDQLKGVRDVGLEVLRGDEVF